MRAPQLHDSLSSLGFVKFDESLNESNHFINAIIQNQGDSNKEFLRNLSSAFEANSIKSIEEIQLSFSNIYDFSKWLISNRSTISFELVSEKILPAPLKPGQKNLLWENLFYQIITKKSSAIRDMLMSILVADNFLTRLAELDKEDLAVLKSLASAKVVIPEYFVKSKLNTNVPVKQLALNDKTLRKKLDGLVAEKQITELQSAVRELNCLKKQYDKQNTLAYNDAKNDHAKKVHDLNKTAKKTQRFYIDKDTGIERALTDQEYVEIPDFEYKPISEMDFLKNSNLISARTRELILEMPITDPSISDTISDLENEIGNQSDFLVTVSPPQSQTIINDGGLLLPVTPNPPTTHLGNLVMLSAQSLTGASEITLLFNNLPLGTDVVSAEYSAQFNSSTITGNSFTDSWANNHLTVSLFTESFNYGNLTAFTISGHLILSDFSKIEFEIDATVFSVRTMVGFLQKRAEGTGIYTKSMMPSAGEIPEPQPAEPEDVLQPTYGVTRLGITDYRKVEQEICCYVPGEVSHIENIMAREFKEKTVRRSRKTEETFSSTSEMERENLTDTSTTERFEMNQEANSVISKQMQMAAQAGIHWGDNNFGGDAHASFAHSTASENSNHQAVTHAKEMTERVLDRVVQKVKEERISKITEEYSEENTHGFDNRKGEEHVSGVYRWVDKIYKNKVVNYGKRLMYEFMIPEPSAFHNTVGLNQQNTLATTIVKPIDPRKQTGSFQLKDLAILQSALICIGPEFTMPKLKPFLILKFL
ncbi:hypothetical protein GV828_12825 [Flavobacterium sp. NST-5]|uniref:Uncharacterized protein n=2 Tax=Flavobacterium ichthyis TaxID=2698827 RepID=A0ABW9ZC28_9FLAO|nr:hypothetical protein [Flavobacterium ichthyis]